MKEKEKLQDALEQNIYSLIANTGKDCTLIVMHPHTWYELTSYLFSVASMAIYNSDLKYKGIKVLRSYDIEEGVFEVR